MIIMTIAQMLEEGIKLGGNGRALFDDERVVTYPQLRKSAERIFCFLRSKGVCTGDAVAIVMPRSIDYVIAETAWEWTMFNPEEKQRRHETVFPLECQKEFQKGAALVNT